MRPSTVGGHRSGLQHKIDARRLVHVEHDFRNLRNRKPFGVCGDLVAAHRQRGDGVKARFVRFDIAPQAGIAAAFLAPTPDAISMAMMGAPMYLLYEICIFVAWMMERKRKKEQDSLSG